MLTFTSVLALIGCKDGGGDGPAAPVGAYSYDVPLDPDSPWPKFRRTARQDGRSPVLPVGGGPAWTVATGKGIFSTPVIDGEGSVYVGSADRSFYALDAEGAVRWTWQADEIIDSSALLDDQGRVIFGAGDGHLRALDREDGSLLWDFEADDPSVNGAFIRWFEGNVGILPDGCLVVPNDNFCVYGVDRQTGAKDWCFRTLDQTWALPAVDAASGRLFVANNFLLGTASNLFGVEPDGALVWGQVVSGTLAASPLLWGDADDGTLFVGSFDGYLRAFAARDGDLLWELPTRDHLYASPGQLSDGTLIQPSADGTVYAVDPATGALRWAFDTLDPIRSSPAIDGQDNIYVGSGAGTLWVITAQGELAWAIQLVDQDRNDLNASPALGEQGVVIAGESGEIFHVPYDACADGADSRCIQGPGEALPTDAATLLYTTAFGSPRIEPPAQVDPSQPLVFSLLVRGAGDTVLALLDAESLSVQVSPAVDFTLEVSADRRFLTMVPAEAWAFDGGELRVSFAGDYLVDPAREGLRFEGGSVGGSLAADFRFAAAPAQVLAAALPMTLPAGPGAPTGVWEWSRLAAPLPTILPSYNQIGFDSLHYLIGLVTASPAQEGQPQRGVAWVVGARLDEATGLAVPDPATQALFPMQWRWQDGQLVAENDQSFRLNVMSADIAFDSMRLSTRLDESGEGTSPPALVVTATCGDIPFYGAFLRDLGFCNPDSDQLVASGAILLQPREDTAAEPVDVALSWEGDTLVATVQDGPLLAEHVVALLVLDEDGLSARSLDYGVETVREVDAGGRVTTVRLPIEEREGSGSLRVALMVDAAMAWEGTIPW